MSGCLQPTVGRHYGGLASRTTMLWWVAGSDEASERGRKVAEALLRKGGELGFEAVAEYPVQGGRLDVVWLLRPAMTIPGVDEALPIVGFEIESSWRTRKHIKGDYLNLADLGAALGVIVLLGDGKDVDATRRFASILVDRPGSRILVWSERDVDVLMQETSVWNTVTRPVRADDFSEFRRGGAYRQIPSTVGLVAYPAWRSSASNVCRDRGDHRDAVAAIVQTACSPLVQLRRKCRCSGDP